MNKLSVRLEAVANYVDDNSKVIDIGCDHGFLSIFLAKKYDNIKIIASDINENALNNAISNINKLNLQNKIEVDLMLLLLMKLILLLLVVWDLIQLLECLNML